jgi:signal transduction histidine kinase
MNVRPPNHTRSFHWSNRLTDRAILRALAIGLTMVGVLLTAAALVAIRDSQAIRRGTAIVAREQLVMARLLHEVQVQQNALTEILHRLANLSEAPRITQLLDDLDAADQTMESLMSEAGNFQPDAAWEALAYDIRAFTGEAREAVHREQSLSVEQTQRLFAHHDRVVAHVDTLLQSSSDRLRTAELEIERQSTDLATQSILLLGACFAMASLCAVATIRFTARGIRRLESQAGELARVSWHMLRTQEEAARRFSHELHDELGQSLAAVRACASYGTFDDERREDCIRLVDQAIANVREMSQLLRPVILDDFGLDAGIRWLVEKFAQRTGIEAQYESDISFRLEDEVETHLFRIAQEALTNIARHSGAKNIRIQLSAPAPNAPVQLMIEDDGRGLLVRGEGERPSIGMTGMRARATQCGGDLVLEEVRPSGLRLTVTVPPPRERNRKDGTSGDLEKEDR